MRYFVIHSENDDNMNKYSVTADVFYENTQYENLGPPEDRALTYEEVVNLLNEKSDIENRLKLFLLQINFDLDNNGKDPKHTYVRLGTLKYILEDIINGKS